MDNILESGWFGNTLGAYIVFLIVFLTGVLAIHVFKRIILKRVKEWTQKTATPIDDFVVYIIEKIWVPLLYFGVFYFAINTLSLSPKLSKIINVIGVFLFTIFAIRFSVAVVSYAFELFWLKREKDIAKEKSLKGLLRIIKIVIWGVGLTFLLDNLGFNITSVIAGLGIGGVAVALAAQAILGDLFSYVSIIFDRPFEAGDFIIIGEYLGTVEHIGIKTTRIRSLSGEQLVFSNTDLTNSRVRNYKRMEKRRVVFRLGVTYQTTLQQLKEIPGIIADIIKRIDDAVLDRAHFFSYGDFSLIFEIVYYIIGSDYNKYMDIQQEINLAIKEEFEMRGIEFAYPTQTLYITKI